MSSVQPRKWHRVLALVFAFMASLMILPIGFCVLDCPDWWSFLLGPPLVFLTVVFVALHGKLSIGLRDTAELVATSAIAGFAAEFISLRWSTLFGARYSYPAERWSGGYIGEMPVLIPLFWAVYIYIGHSTVNSFLHWLGKEKPHRGGGALLLWLAIAADATVVVLIDLFMDPIMAFRGSWTWETDGPYFGVPAGNFAGWFLVAAVSAGLFRTREYYRRAGDSPDAPDSVHLMPVLAYGLLACGFAVYALRIMGNPWLALVGLSAMGGVVLLNGALYCRWRARLIQGGPLSARRR